MPSLPVRIPQGVERVLAGPLCGRDVGDHACTGVPDERVFEDMCELTLTERRVSAVLVNGSNALFELRK